MGAPAEKQRARGTIFFEAGARRCPLGTNNSSLTTAKHREGSTLVASDRARRAPLSAPMTADVFRIGVVRDGADHGCEVHNAARQRQHAPPGRRELEPLVRALEETPDQALEFADRLPHCLRLDHELACGGCERARLGRVNEGEQLLNGRAGSIRPEIVEAELAAEQIVVAFGDLAQRAGQRDIVLGVQPPHRLKGSGRDLTVAVKIRARAIDRAGELMRQIESDQEAEERKRQNLKNGSRRAAPDPSGSRAAAAAAAGLSPRQQKTALRVNAVPRDEFEELVERGASYARQSKDDSLRKTADRIQARAVRRCGELLAEIKRPPQGGRPAKNGGDAPPVSRARAAIDAGLSRDQKRTALRVAAVPELDFEAAVEGDDPPTITELAERWHGAARHSLARHRNAGVA